MEERPPRVTSLWWAGLVIVSGGALYLTVVAYSEGLPSIFQTVDNFDKLAHFGFAGMLATCLDGVLRRRAAFVLGGQAIPLSAVLVLVPAGLEEYLQRYSVHRTSSIWDFAADLAGVIVFVSLSRRLAK